MSKDETFDLAEVGRRMRILRNYQRKTQRDMAHELGISLSHYSKLEIGIGGMSNGLIMALCRQFGVEEEWLYHGTGVQPDFDRIAEESKQAWERVKNAAVQPADYTNEVLESMISTILTDDFRQLAEQVARSMNITVARAMTILLREKMRPNQKHQ